MVNAEKSENGERSPDARHALTIAQLADPLIEAIRVARGELGRDFIRALAFGRAFDLLDTLADKQRRRSHET